ncbi:MAG: SusC/RagA family protein [Cytophagales bacterium CG18_big_fil_WC_8_21_14_2_50_42_9]|nr:MAG: SusC/RagA family protein [Cytophagales bacterium CG18_big_fil_WC_8_21_14_2_50_42_9]
MKRFLSLFFLLALLSVQAELWAQVAVSGTVTDATKGDPLPGVSIIIKGTTQGGVSDVNGNFNLQAPDANSILVFSFIGYQSKEVPVNGQTRLNVSLLVDNKALEEVVVVGYGAVKKSDLTGSVGTLKGAELNKTPAASVDQLLQGKIAGVQVIAPSGQPGAGATIRIRGVSSLSGSNSPLVVVDGFPWGDAGNLKQINPEDIESIEVLKDASSAAIYGSRGANGVIMITTKKGRAGAPRITLSTLNTISTLPVKLDLWRDPIEEAIYANEAALNGGVAPDQLPYLGKERSGVYFPSVAELRGLDPNKPQWPYNTDWVDLVYRNPFSQSYTLSADGGNENTKYSISGNYYKEEGLVKLNYFDKYTGRLNLDQKLTNAVNVGTNLILTHTKSNGQQVNADRSRIFPAYDETGNYFRTASNDYGNPLAVLNEVLNTGKTIDVLGTIYANIQFTDWLQFRSQLSSKYGNSVGDNYQPATVTFSGAEAQGLGSVSNYNNTELLNENYLTANKNFGDAHRFNVVAGYSIQKSVTRTSNLVGRNFVNDNLRNENLGSAGIQTISNDLTRSKLASWFGRVNYTLKDRYLFTLTGRADGSTKFGANNKWAFFPSGAFAWRVIEEDFMQSLSAFSDLKLRASYGVTGNQGISPYQSLDRFGSGFYWSGGVRETGYGPGLGGSNNEQGLRLIGGLGNNSLKWETTNSLDVGIDFGFLDQRFTLTADYYMKNTYDLLRIRSVSPSSGYDEQWVNDGEINNKGFELGANAAILEGNGLTWNVGANFTLNRNKVVAMGENNLVPVGTLYETIRQNANYFAIGEPAYSFYGYKTAGIIQTLQEGLEAGLTGAEAQPGEIKYVDLDENGVIDGNDRTIIGNPNPNFLYSFNTSLTFKGFDLSAQLYGVQGNDVFDFRKMTPSRQIIRWTPDNPSNEYPRANSTRGYRASDFFLTDGSFLRLQNVTLGYNVPTGTIRGVKSLRIYVSGNNLYTFTKFNTGFDPEMGENGVNQGAYPRPRAMSLGINLGF